jgi:RNA 2',3'-cyclic 3'-phosphodiesterase
VSASSSAVRAFVALEIPSAARAVVADLQQSLRSRFPGLRWLHSETIHLTLRFLADSSPDALACLQPKLAGAAAACPATDVRIAGLGVFPDRGSPRVLWLGVELPGSMLALQRHVEAAAVTCGFAHEDKPFRSHLTLGRWRDRTRRPELPAIDIGSIAIRSLILYKSELRSPHAIHTPLATFALRNTPA